MAQFGRTWWGQRFLAALEQFTDPARLGRGRSYASGGRILDYTVGQGTVTARVRGTPDKIKTFFHEDCYPGDEGTFFERVEDDRDDTD